MAGDQSNEILMRFVNSDRIYVGAECQTAVDTDSDDLAADYNPGSFFAVDDFAFGMNIDDKDPAADSANASGGKGIGATTQNVPTGPQVKFGAWKRASPPDPTATKSFPLRMDEFSITRRYDRASVLLFEKCATSDNLLSASMIKRKIVGEDRLQTFLRFDFQRRAYHPYRLAGRRGHQGNREIRVPQDHRPLQNPNRRRQARAVGSVSWEYDAALRKPAKGG